MNDISSSNKAADAAFSLDFLFPRPKNAAARLQQRPHRKSRRFRPFQQFLGFDTGIKRTVAPRTATACWVAPTPLPTIKAEAADARLAAVEKLIREWQPNAW